MPGRLLSVRVEFGGVAVCVLRPDDDLQLDPLDAHALPLPAGAWLGVIAGVHGRVCARVCAST